MTSQPLVASFCVDYLSHPLSSEHLLVCYQQITRQIAHAPLSAKDAAISFQHQSQAMIELLGQHQNLAIPQTKERPAPVGCQSQLKRMQNALWRRSSQSSLAKDVALVRPESLNWQKECDVLWLYGPLYNAAVQPAKQDQSCEWTTTSFSQYSPQQHAFSPSSLDGSTEIESLAITPAAISSPLDETTTSTTETTTLEEVQGSVPEAPTVETQPSLPLSTPCDSVSPYPAVAVETATAVSTTTATTTPALTTTLTTDASIPADLHSGADADASSTKVAPLQIDTSSAAVKNDAVDAPSASPSSLTSSPVEENALSRPQKSALKQLGTMTQTFEELRSFTQSPQYLALAKALATFSLTASTEEAGEEGSLVAIADGTRSEPMSPISNNSHSTFLLPIFPAPTKYHFRSHDHRRASFPKSASHPRSLNININLNMNVSVHQPAKSSTSSNGRRATIGGIGHCHHHNGSQLIPSASAKQLRFSLEVQELIFLPTSPPFRISRAKPTRAHSDPAIQTMSRSSFFAPSHSGNHYQDHSSLSPAWQHSLHQAGLISTATASAASFENTTTTFIKVHASQDGRPSRYGSSRHYLPGDGSDDYYFEDCRETNGGNMTTDDEGDDEDEDDDFDEEDEEYDEFNGLARNKHGHADKNRRHRRSHHRHSRRYRLSSKNDTAAQPKDAAVRGPGVLWQVYTAVTGVKELIAWYGSMVYHSSSL